MTLKHTAYGFIMGLALMILPNGAYSQENLAEILQRFEGFVAERNFPKALEELEWVRRGLEKEHYAIIEVIFPEQLGDFEGQPMSRQEILGISTHTKTYSGKSGETLDVSLTIGMKSGGFAAIEQFARLLGTQVNSEQVRIDGRTATLVGAEDGKASVSIQLNSGGMLRFQLSMEDGDAVIAAAKAFGVGRLDDYLSGDNPEIKSRL